MVLQPAPRVRAELRVADDDARAVDERDAIAERVARAMGQRVGVGAGLPFRADHTSHARQLVALLLDQPIAETPARDQHDRGHHRRHDDEGAGEEPTRERHAGRLCGTRSR